MAKKTRDEMAAIEFAALEEAIRELNKFQNDDSEPTDPFGAILGATGGAGTAAGAPAEPAEESPAGTSASAEEVPAEKKRRRPKASIKKADGDAPSKKTPAKKTSPSAKSGTKAAARTPRKKAYTPNFVIQNSADAGITYESVVEKVLAAIAAAEVTSIDIYVKAEEGKAYYVVNGEAAGSVDLF